MWMTNLNRALTIGKVLRDRAYTATLRSITMDDKIFISSASCGVDEVAAESVGCEKIDFIAEKKMVFV